MLLRHEKIKSSPIISNVRIIEQDMTRQTDTEIKPREHNKCYIVLYVNSVMTQYNGKTDIHIFRFKCHRDCASKAPHMCFPDYYTHESRTRDGEFDIESLCRSR